MSYILDALKKSEQERNSQPSADMIPPQQAETTMAEPPRKRWIWLIPALLVGNITLLLWPAPSSKSTVESITESHQATTITQERSETTATQASPDTMASAGTLLSTEQPSTATQTHPLPAENSEILPRTKADQTPYTRYHRDPFAPLPGHTAQRQPQAAAAPQHRKETIRQLPQPDIEQLNRSLLNQALIEQLAPLRQAEQQARQASPQLITSFTDATADSLTTQDNRPDTGLEANTEPNENRLSQVRIPLLNELDAELQDAIPDLNISVHIYSEAPDQRMARVNGKMLRQGQTLNSELTLDEIRPDSLIFSFRGESFRLLK